VASDGAEAQGHVLLHPEVASKVFALLPSFAISQPPPAQTIPSPALLASSDLEQLTEREREILLMLARGASNREISEALYITGGTVKNHLSKLGVRDRTQAALKARELGML
jgi:DNA-binding NarL/FixJ family response regulator